MKNKTKLVILAAVILCFLFAVCGCSANDLAFEKNEYEVYNGDCVTAVKGAEYAFVGYVPEGVELDVKSGKITFGDQVPNHSQVLMIAKKGGFSSVPIVVTLLKTDVPPEITFTNLAKYIISGETVHAKTSPVYSVTYKLKQAVAGISVEEGSGKVEFAPNVAEGTQFTIVASSKGVFKEMAFKASVENYVTATKDEAIALYKGKDNVTFILDFGTNAEAEETGVMGVMRGNNLVPDENGRYWSYDADEKKLTLKAAFLDTLSMGETAVKIVTAKNSVQVKVKTAKFISTAKELAAINDGAEALSGYYIMVCDIDLTAYLSSQGDGYDNGKGWRPIGTYHDVLDGTAYADAFSGTFDGNGYTVSGLWMNRSDDLAYNSGLFGYTTSSAVITDLGVKSAINKSNNVRSYSGGFVGGNEGTVRNCFAEVNVETGEAYKVVGGFVGRNVGKVENCYSLGNVTSGSVFGSFCGWNEGTILNCYSVSSNENAVFSGQGIKAENSEQYSSQDELKTADFSKWTDWTVIAGELPRLKNVQVEYSLREILVTNTETTVTKGDIFQLTLATNPADKIATERFDYEVVKGNGVIVGETGKVDTRNAQEHYCEIKVSSGEVETYFSFYIYDKVKGVSFTNDMETTMYAGKYYRLTTTITPASANPAVEYEIVSPLEGVTLDGEIIAVSEYAAEGEFTVRAKAGQFTAELKIKVKAEVGLNSDLIIFRNAPKNAVFVLPEGEAGKIVKTTRFKKSVPFAVDGNKIVVEHKYLTNFGTKEVPVKFVTDDGVTYACKVSVYDSSEEVVYIGSTEEFTAFKNSPDLFGKVVILTADIDFGNAAIVSVGSHHTETDFTGIFNGNGHTIKNLVVVRNDFDEDEGKGDYVEYRYHSSYYNVGLFSYVTGTVCNLTLENVTVRPVFQGDGEVTGNFVGVIAGTLKGEIRNVNLVNCAFDAGGSVKGWFAGTMEGVITNSRVDGKLYE